MRAAVRPCRQAPFREYSPCTPALPGNVRGEPPCTGTLRHRGWRASDVHLPQLTEGHDVTVIAPAEVEL